jgi:hypothetical protein
MPNGGVRIEVEAGNVLRSLVFPADLVDKARARDLIEATAMGLTLSGPGRSLVARHSAAEAPFLAQHTALARESISHPEGESEVLVDQAESPLAWLRRRRGKDGASLVSDRAFLAGERLRADFTRANLMPRVTANWHAAVASGRRAGPAGLDFSDLVLAARQRVTAALDAVGPELSGVLLDVCCFLKGLEEVEGERLWPVRSGKVVLALALDRLAAHYGMAAEARGPARGRMRAWGAAGYRPRRSSATE